MRELQGAYTLCLGSDGVFEFLSNKALLELMTAHLERPLLACRSVCARSALLSPLEGSTHETEEQRERREILYHHRDDTSIICVHIQTQKNDQQQ